MTYKASKGFTFQIYLLLNFNLIYLNYNRRKVYVHFELYHKLKVVIHNLGWLKQIHINCYIMKFFKILELNLIIIYW